MLKKGGNNSSRARYNQRQINPRQNGGGMDYRNRMQSQQQQRPQTNGGYGAANANPRQTTRFSSAPTPTNAYQMPRSFNGAPGTQAQKPAYPTNDYQNGTDKRPMAYQTQNSSYYDVNAMNGYQKTVSATPYAQQPHQMYQAAMPSALYATPPPPIVQYSYPPPIVQPAKN